MKKVILVALVALCFCTTGCGSTNENGIAREEYESVVAERDDLQERVSLLENELANGNQKTEMEDAFLGESESSVDENGTAVLSDNDENAVEILAEYTLSDGIGWFTRHFMVIKNNSNETVDISTSSLAYGEDGIMVGAEDAGLNALGAGCVSVFYEAFEVDAEIDYYETEIDISKSKYYESVIQDLSYVQNDIENGAIFQVTNNGEDAAKFVEGYALFFLGEELVGYESAYFTDDDSEIKPGKTISKQMTLYKDFDRIEFYLTGRK